MLSSKLMFETFIRDDAVAPAKYETTSGMNMGRRIHIKKVHINSMN